MLTKFPSMYTIEWHYFQANHGKGAVDGVGGTIKNTVFRKVLSKEVVMYGPKHFAEFANSILPSITVLFIQNAKSTYEEECRENAIAIPGTLKVHKVMRQAATSGYKLIFKDNSSTNSNQIKEEFYSSRDLNGNVTPLKIGDFVIVTYEDEKFPAEVTHVESNDSSLVTVKCMKKDREAGSIWCWPKRDDVIEHYNMYSCERAQNPKLYGKISDRILKYYIEELAERWGTVDLSKCIDLPE